MKDFCRTLSELHSSKPTDDGYLLFASESISLGNFKNAMIDGIVENLRIYVGHIKREPQTSILKAVKEPQIDVANALIYIPSKQHFRDEMSYYHALLHEVAHYISYFEDQPTAIAMHIALRAYKEECKLLNIKPIINLNDLIDTVNTEKAFKSTSKVTQARALAYLKEEIKVETVTMHILSILGYADKQSSINVIDQANKIANFAGIDFREEITNASTAYSKEAAQLASAIESRLK